MSSKTKKQHYVPQCYLENWAIDGSHQIYVYDKKTYKQRKNNITDVASENYFYDIDLTGILTNDKAKEMGFSNFDPAKADEDQFIEHFFADNVEGKYKALLNKIVQRASQMNPWELKNCFFLSDEEKVHFSLQLAFQFLRVKSVRNMINDSNDCLLQVLNEMKINPEVKEQYTFKKEQLPYIHGSMLMTPDSIEKFKKTFFSFVWILAVNQTKQSFITSDCPIGTIPHKSHPFMSMSGLMSSGIEVFFPLSPTFMLLMFDGDYHTNIASFDRRIIEIDNTDDVDLYNTRNAINCNRFIFSKNDDFSFIEKLLKKHPDIFEKPHTQVQWGGKTFYPNK